eukprot:495989-Rhodomonas_salina.1
MQAVVNNSLSAVGSITLHWQAGRQAFTNWSRVKPEGESQRSHRNTDACYGCHSAANANVLDDGGDDDPAADSDAMVGGLCQSTARRRSFGHCKRA